MLHLKMPFKEVSMCSEFVQYSGNVVGNNRFHTEKCVIVYKLAKMGSSQSHVKFRDFFKNIYFVVKYITFPSLHFK